jgi:hypothetical protein
MADLTTLRNNLAAQITQYTGLRCDGQARDQVTPPCAVVIPGQPFIRYGTTMGECMAINLAVLLIISDAAPVEMTQRALDAYLGVETTNPSVSVPEAVLKDPTLGGIAEWCEPVSISSYGRIEYGGVTYFGARVNLDIGATSL